MPLVMSFSRCMLTIVSVALIAACAGPTQKPLTLAIGHLNDTHSHLEPDTISLTINGTKTATEVGGFARIKTAVDAARRASPNYLLLHAGDAVQGTLFFTLFNGTIEFDLLNALGVDAMTFGNHEFDRGADYMHHFVERARFPLVSANVDFSSLPDLASRVSPYVIKSFPDGQVAIIGVTTETTPQTTRDVGAVVFSDAAAAVRSRIQELQRQGINKIIVLSHLGYAADKKLAATVAGIDLIVGGHTHSLLGEPFHLRRLGLEPDGPYPTEVVSPAGEQVLVVQAWQWGYLLGGLELSFSATGLVDRYTAQQTLLIGDRFSQNDLLVQPNSELQQQLIKSITTTDHVAIIPEDAGIKEQIAPYAQQLLGFRREIVAMTDSDLTRGLNRGPGPIVADSMLAAVPRAQVALLNYGGVRRDLPKGNISVGDILELMPFNNSLVLLDLTGAELHAALEEGVDFLLTKFPEQYPPALPYLAGLRCTVIPSAAKGLRVQQLRVLDATGAYQPLVSDAVHRIVVNAFVANGGDGFTTIKRAKAFRSDTGIIDSDALRNYLQQQRIIPEQTEQRILLGALFPGLLYRVADGYADALNRFVPSLY